MQTEKCAIIAAATKRLLTVTALLVGKIEQTVPLLFEIHFKDGKRAGCVGLEQGKAGTVKLNFDDCWIGTLCFPQLQRDRLIIMASVEGQLNGLASALNALGGVTISELKL